MKNSESANISTVDEEEFQAFEFDSKQSQDSLVSFFQRTLLYSEIKDLDVISLPRGGVSVATNALGSIQVRQIFSNTFLVFHLSNF
jgi:hypothetical protein